MVGVASEQRTSASAPVRVADVGGWTDTWFGSPGRVCNLAVGPGVGVEVVLRPGPSVVRVSAPAIGDAWEVRAPGPDGTDRARSGPRQLVESALAEVLGAAGADERVGARTVEVAIQAAVPAGASLGTSAAVLVALLAAADAAVFERLRPPGELAAWAHTVETRRAGREAGVQDHWAAACGGASLFDVAPYPKVRHTRVEVADAAVAELADGLVTVVFGAHDSSAVHRSVIDALVSCGGVEHDTARTVIRRLARLAGEAAAALGDGDLGRWAEVLTASTAAQAELHEDLVGPAHRRAIELARAHGAAGWKVNGAGGSGGSLTAFVPGGAAGPLASAFRAVPGWVVPDLAPAGGVAVA